MTKYSEMSAKNQRVAKAELKERLRWSINPTVISNVSEDGCILEGGCLCARFSHNEGLTVWGTARRYTGSPLTIGELVEAEKTIEKWFEKYM